MKSRHLYWLLFFGCLVALFFVIFNIKIVNAEVLYSQTAYDTYSEWGDPDTGGCQQNIWFQQQFAASSTIIRGEDFTVKLRYDTAGYQPKPTYLGTADASNFISGISLSNGVCATKSVNNGITTYSMASSTFWSETCWKAAWDIPNGITIFSNYVEANDSRLLGSQSNTYPNFETAWFNACAGLDHTPDIYIHDIYFIIEQGPPITNSVSINTISTSTTASISFNWQYQLDSATTSLGYYTIFADWDLYKCDPDCDTKIGSNLGYNSHPNSNIATGTTAGFSLDNGNYQIKNFYLKYDSVGEGSITASTTKVDSNEFSVSYSSPYIPIISLPTSTISTTTPIQITCDPNDNWFQFSLCKLGIWLFVPSQSVLNQFSNLTVDISQKPPIGYFTSIKNSLLGLTSSTPAFTINVSSTDPVATNFFTPIRTGLIWILWLGFAFWIFNRFRHFNLTNP